MLSRSIEQAVQRQGFWLVAFIFMPEHVHLLAYPMFRETRGREGGHGFGPPSLAKELEGDSLQGPAEQEHWPQAAKWHPMRAGATQCRFQLCG